MDTKTRDENGHRAEDALTAIVPRREPDYSAGGEYDAEAGNATHQAYGFGEELEDLARLSPRGQRALPWAGESRLLTVVDYGQLSIQGVADGTGLAQLDFGYTVPANQFWLIDNVIARGGAAGSIFVYERGNIAALNDLDLVYAKALLAPGFAVSDYPNELVLRPGSHPFAAFVGAGAAATCTAKIMYRVAVMSPGFDRTQTP